MWAVQTIYIYNKLSEHSLDSCLKGAKMDSWTISGETEGGSPCSLR